ncbi:MAG: hypothetical protein K2O06_07440 [Acetatifactor sp.]|nr:hypothetical protein [Acetatifactor sp.]
MLDAIFQILSVLGIVLLSLLGILLVLLLLILFFPVTYRLTGTKSPSETWLRIRVTWLFGIFRLRYQMPDPGNVTAKLLWFTVFDSRRKKPAKEHQPNEISCGEPQTKETEKRKAAEKQPQEQPAKEKHPEQPQPAEERTGQQPQPVEEQAGQQEHHAEEPEQKPEETASQGFFDRLWKKLQKLKYTICNIYDKIKQIRENISYYAALLRSESTRELFHCGKRHLGRILKSLRPRRIRADILFGTGAPDTTGYAMGIYGILSPHLGNGVYVTPDFTQAVLQGSVDIAGHAAVFTVLWNGARLFLDRRLQEFIKKWKAGGKKDGR